MEISQARLALLYFNACMLGAALGLLYDGMRLIRIFFGEHFSSVANRFRDVKLPLIHMSEERKKRSRLLSVLIFAEDFIFCLVAAVAMILLFYQINNGKLRAWAFPMAGVGFYLYRITVGRLVMLCSETVAFLLEAAFRYLCFFVMLPWKWVFTRVALAVYQAWQRCKDRKEKRERMRYTDARVASVESDAVRVFFGEVQKKGMRRDVKAKETVQLESAGESFSGGDRGSVHRRVRQQRHEI